MNNDEFGLDQHLNACSDESSRFSEWMKSRVVRIIHCRKSYIRLITRHLMEYSEDRIIKRNYIKKNIAIHPLEQRTICQKKFSAVVLLFQHVHAILCIFPSCCKYQPGQNERGWLSLNPASG